MTFSDNASTVTWFTLSGFDEMMEHRATFFSLSLLCYCAIILVNVALILTIVLDENLHEPMYIFLCNLCISGLLGTTGFYPKFLLDLLSHLQVISYARCLIQSFVIYSSSCGDFVILAVMAYDRYVAICRPLEYHSVMTRQRVAWLVSYPWLSTICLMTVSTILTSKLRLCGSHLEKLYCANWPIVKLSCTSMTVNNIMGYITILFYVGHITFIVCSYVFLIKSCLKSIENRGKFMQTCMPHLLSLINVAVALLFEVFYSRYGSTDVSQNFQNFMAVQFLVIPPILNPLIYGLKLKQIRNRIFSLYVRSTRRKKSLM
ncbi:olfactory receptor 1030-like [Hypomesus transpacificus]|uniref:olfactory receptor 1030-like n=1 Tax=Hypomesus transpacificus TaxID=137520 RepID=UPI001F0744A0|nr:olfactory receptor 1030-like [Hypomesus transpacificus]